MKRGFPPLVFVVLSLACFLGTLYMTAQRLPERVASHFNAAGIPDGWAERSKYLWTFGGIGVGLCLLMLGIFFTIRFFPPSMLNLPRRDYWLAPERREWTYAYLFRIGAMLAATELIFLLVVHLLVVSANLAEPPRLSGSIWVALAGMLIAMTILTVVFIRRFSRTT